MVTNSHPPMRVNNKQSKHHLSLCAHPPPLHRHISTTTRWQRSPDAAHATQRWRSPGLQVPPATRPRTSTPAARTNTWTCRWRPTAPAACAAWAAVTGARQCSCTDDNESHGGQQARWPSREHSNDVLDNRGAAALGECRAPGGHASATWRRPKHTTHHTCRSLASHARPAHHRGYPTRGSRRIKHSFAAARSCCCGIHGAWWYCQPC